MRLTNIPQGSEKGPTEKFWRLGGSPHHRPVRQFTINKWWHTTLRSAVYAGIGMLLSAMTVLMIATFPWDDSTVEEKQTILFLMLPWAFLCHDLLAILFFVLAVRTWADPHALIFDGEEYLILKSVVRPRRIAVEAINTIKIDEQKRANKTLWEQCVVTKFSGGTLILPPFKQREKFLKALKAVNPAIAIETV